MYRQPALDVPLLTCAYPGRIVARDLRTGRLAWEFRFTDQQVTGASRVLVENGRVYAMGITQRPPQGFFGTIKSPAVVACLDYMTGAHVWSVEVDDIMTSATMMIVGEQLIVADGTYVAALHVASARRCGASKMATSTSKKDRSGIRSGWRCRVARSRPIAAEPGQALRH